MPFNRRSEEFFKRFTASSSSKFTLLVGLVISLDDFEELRIVSNNNSLFYAGQEYVPANFDFKFPGDAPPALPGATINLSDVPSHIASLLERYRNRNVQVRVQQFVVEPDITRISYEVDMHNSRVRVSEKAINIELGFSIVVVRPYTNYIYGQEIAPGLLP